MDLLRHCCLITKIFDAEDLNWWDLSRCNSIGTLTKLEEHSIWRGSVQLEQLPDALTKLKNLKQLSLFLIMICHYLLPNHHHLFHYYT